MRLRNKKTGETRVFYYLHPALPNGSVLLGLLDDDGESQTHTYGSLADFNEEWEDYKPAEPLIKDPKSRKVVRPWLEANDLDGATFHKSSHFFHYWNLRGFNDNGMGVDIDFFLTGDGIPNLIDGKYYTKFELCGEEEE